MFSIRPVRTDDTVSIIDILTGGYCITKYICRNKGVSHFTTCVSAIMRPDNTEMISSCKLVAKDGEVIPRLRGT